MRPDTYGDRAFFPYQNLRRKTTQGRLTQIPTWMSPPRFSVLLPRARTHARPLSSLFLGGAEAETTTQFMWRMPPPSTWTCRFLLQSGPAGPHLKKKTEGFSFSFGSVVLYCIVLYVSSLDPLCDMGFRAVNIATDIRARTFLVFIFYYNFDKKNKGGGFVLMWRHIIGGEFAWRELSVVVSITRTSEMLQVGLADPACKLFASAFWRQDVKSSVILKPFGIAGFLACTNRNSGRQEVKLILIYFI